MSRPAESHRQLFRRVSVAGLGVLLCVGSLSHLLFDRDALVTDTVEVAVPVVFSLTLIGFGTWLVRAGVDPRGIARIAAWCVGGILVLGLLGGWETLLLLREGTPADESVFLVTTDVTVGAGVGSLVGLYDVRRRERFREVQRVRAALEASPDGIALLDDDAEYVDVTGSHADIYGYDDPAAFLGNTWRMCYPDERVDEIEARVMPALEADGEWRGELVGERRDGTTFPQEVTLSRRGDGGIVCIVRDITERKRYERRLNALHETTRELMTATSHATIATRASEAASDILDLPLNGIHLRDDAVGGLVPVAWSPETEDVIGTPPTVSPGDGVAWQTFETGESRVFDDVSDADGVYDPDTPIRSEIHLPLGDHGVFLVGATTPKAFDQTDVALARLLATNVETALDRADREQALRDREDELTRERDRFATLFEHIPDPAVVVDLDGDEPVTRSVNRAFTDVFGYTGPEAVGASLNDLIVPPGFEEEAEEIDERASADEQIVREVRRRTADGEPRDFLFRNVPIGSGTGEAYGIYTDITDRKRRERMLEALNEVTRDQIRASSPAEVCELAVAAARDTLDLPLSGIHLFDEADRTLRPVAVTPEVTDHLGEADLTYTDRGTLVWKAFEEGERRVVQDAREIPATELPTTETPVRSALILPLGRHGVFIVSAPEPNAFDDDDVRLAELLAATTGITLDRATRERTLERLHEATRELMTTADDGEIADITLAAARDVLGFSLASVRYLDAEGDALVPVAVTDAGRETLGEPEAFSDDESLAWEPLERGEPRVVEDVTEYDSSVNAGTGVRSLIILPLGEYGTLNIAAMTPDAFDEADVSVARILAANVEAALDRAADERELRRRERELRRQNERLDEFASVLSHDLRNPLNVAQGRLDLARHDCESEHLDAVGRAHERIETLIEDVLTLTRQGRAVGETTTVDVAGAASAAWDHVDTGDATLDLDAVGNRTIDADESRLRQLFENLFRNAAEHAGEACTVRVGSLADPPGIYVEDDGPGIPPDEREEVFDSGYSTAPEGTGFGLAIVQQIAEAHGWSVEATTGESGGARFEIRGTTPSDPDD